LPIAVRPVTQRDLPLGDILSYFPLPEPILQEVANLDSRNVDRIGPRTTVKVDDVVEFLVAVTVHPVDEIMTIVPALRSMRRRISSAAS
jgi:hypothetical protein